MTECMQQDHVMIHAGPWQRVVFRGKRGERLAFERFILTDDGGDRCLIRPVTADTIRYR